MTQSWSYSWPTWGMPTEPGNPTSKCNIENGDPSHVGLPDQRLDGRGSMAEQREGAYKPGQDVWGQPKSNSSPSTIIDNPSGSKRCLVVLINSKSTRESSRKPPHRSAYNDGAPDPSMKNKQFSGFPHQQVRSKEKLICSQY
jgi:hypothetical protein